MKENISLEAALALLLDKVTPAAKCNVSLINSVGRVLGQNIRANHNVPLFNKSPLDGYALQAKDTEKAELSNPTKLEVIEETRAGYVARKKVVSGTAIKLMTGAAIPQGADVVIKYEDIEREGNVLKLFYPLKAGSNIILAGEDVKKGEVIAKKGTLITPPLVGLLAAVGQGQVPVFERVKVAVLSTGDELIEPSEQLYPGKIYNSNLPTLGTLCSELGADLLYMGIVPDEKEATVERINQALEADIVITTGGVSVGDYDVVKTALEQLGADMLFWKINMKPGSPVVAAVKNGKLIIGLSGNPAAAFSTFSLIVVPVLKKMMGFYRHLPLKTSAILLDNFDKPSPQRRFLRAKIARKNQKDYVTLTGRQSNGGLKSTLECNALIDIPAGSGPLIAGQEVAVVIIQNAASFPF